MKFFDDNPPGRIISRVGKDIANTDDYLPWLVHVTMWDIVDCTIIPIGILVQFPFMIIFFMISGVVIYFVQSKFRPANREV